MTKKIILIFLVLSGLTAILTVNFKTYAQEKMINRINKSGIPIASEMNGIYPLAKHIVIGKYELNLFNIIISEDQDKIHEISLYITNVSDLQCWRYHYMNQVLQGIVCATVTPFTPEGAVDEKSIRSLCRYLIDSKINGLYPLGTNGEGVLLNTAERKRVAEIFVSEVQHEIPVVIQCGAITTAEAVELARHAASVKADGIGIMTPFFFHQDEEALIAYYTAIAKAAPELPMYVYNIPSHTNNDILPETVAKLAHLIPNLVGVKYSVPNLIRLSEYMQAVPSAGTLIGCDRLILPALSLGAVGTVTGPAMAFPHLFTGLFDAFKRGDLEEARKLQARLLDLDEALAPFPAIPLLKEILMRKGIIDCSLPKAPMRSLNEQELHRIDAVIEEFND